MQTIREYLLELCQYRKDFNTVLDNTERELNGRGIYKIVPTPGGGKCLIYAILGTLKHQFPLAFDGIITEIVLLAESHGITNYTIADFFANPVDAHTSENLVDAIANLTMLLWRREHPTWDIELFEFAINTIDYTFIPTIMRIFSIDKLDVYQSVNSMVSMRENKVDPTIKTYNVNNSYINVNSYKLTIYTFDGGHYSGTA